VASQLGWQVLDSGALYRLTALAVLERGIDPNDAQAVSLVPAVLNIQFHTNGILLDGKEVSARIRHEQIGNLASQIAPIPALRAALLERQRAFRVQPGLVADGRDMGTIVFPDAPLKIFLVADVEARAQRRCNQLIEKGISANLEDLLQDMRERDARDTQRTVAPLVPAQDAHTVDSSNLTIDQTVQVIMDLWFMVASRRGV